MTRKEKTDGTTKMANTNLPSLAVLQVANPSSANVCPLGNERENTMTRNKQAEGTDKTESATSPAVPEASKPVSAQVCPFRIKGEHTMTRTGKKDGTTKAETTNEKEQATGQLTDVQIDALTEETAGKLLALGGAEAQDWIDKGRIIDDYVEALQPNGKFSRPNPFNKLAEREDIPWRPSQLRTYRDAFLLWQQMGGKDGAPKVDVTAMGLVLTLDHEVAKKILNQAAKQKLTTRAVAALVKKAQGTIGGEKTERVTGDWKLLGKAAEQLNSELSRMRECPPEGLADLDVVEGLQILLKTIQALIASLGPKGGAL